MRSSGVLLALLLATATFVLSESIVPQPIHQATTATVGTPEPASAADLEIELVLVAEGLAEPLAVAAPDDGSHRLFAVERFGRIRIIDASGALLDSPFLDLNAQIQAGYLEEGLLGLAFHPDYRENGRFFAAFTD